MKSKGLGDDIAKFTKATGIKTIVDKVNLAMSSPKPFDFIFVMQNNLALVFLV